MKTYSVKQIAEMLNTNPETVRRWIRNKKLKAVQESRKGGNVVTEAELERFIRETPKYFSKVSMVAGMAMISPIASLGAITSGIMASAILGFCEGKSTDDVRIRAEDFKEYLEENIVKIRKALERKRELIKQTEAEIEDLSKRVDQYTFLLEHEDILMDTLENTGSKKGEKPDEQLRVVSNYDYNGKKSRWT